MLLLVSDMGYLVSTIIKKETRYARENKLVDSCSVGALYAKQEAKKDAAIMS